MNPSDNNELGRAPRLQVEVLTGVVVAKVRDATIDFADCQQLRAELTALVVDQSRVVVDLSDVQYADTFGFEQLLSTVKDCPGVVRYRGVRPPLASLFHLCHLERLLETDNKAL